MAICGNSKGKVIPKEKFCVKSDPSWLWILVLPNLKDERRQDSRMEWNGGRI